MDEPTASLTRREVEALAGRMADLARRGIAVLFVSHRLEEVLEVGPRHRAARRRQGRHPRPGRTGRESSTELMTGRRFHYAVRDGTGPAGRVVLELMACRGRASSGMSTCACTPARWWA